MTVRRALPVVALAAALVASASCSDGRGRPAPPVCGPLEVAEYDGDGWECEPDRNVNGIDDEDDAKAAKRKRPSRTPAPKATPTRRR